jgi:signal transduction histidine kinase
MPDQSDQGGGDVSRSSNEGVQKFERRQIIFSFLGLLILIFASMVLNTLHLNAVAAQSTKFISRMIQLQEFREIGLTLEDAKLDYFSEIHYLSKRPDRSFDLPAGKTLIERPGFINAITTERVTVPTVNSLNASDTDQIVYEYGRFRFVPYALCAWLLLLLVSIPQTRLMKKKVEQQYERALALEKDRAQLIVAKEVRHNLRSPLAALMRIPARLPDSVKKDRELLQSTISQIRALIATLGHDAAVQLSENSSTKVYDSLIHSIQEISLAIPSSIQFLAEIDDAIISAKTSHVPHELRAVLGNIVSNSVDAISGKGTIILRARDLATDIEIEIQDSGSGIPNDLINQIFEGGFSHGKSKGTGTGLHHAKRWIETWGGSIKAESKPGAMTSVKILLPIEDRETWYVPRIRIHENQPVFVVEDQESARGLWKIRLDEAGIDWAKIFSSAADFRAAVAELSASDGAAEPIFFLDYDLGNGSNGMDLFSELKDHSEKYLVTGHFDDPTIRGRCETDRVFLLPKSQLPEVPIVVMT